MPDFTQYVIELVEAKSRMRIAKKVIAEQVRAEYEGRILREISERTASIEADFALRLKMASAAGVPGGVIRKNVLKTNDWERWTKWRDLAEIEPERVTIENARKAEADEKAAFVWDLDAGILYLKKDGAGNAFDPIVELDLSTVRYGRNVWVIDATTAEGERAFDILLRERDGLIRFISDEIERAITAGTFTAPSKEN